MARETRRKISIFFIFDRESDLDLLRNNNNFCGKQSECNYDCFWSGHHCAQLIHVERYLLSEKT